MKGFKIFTSRFTMGHIHLSLSSQDDKGAYITFAKYEQTWVRYIRNGRRHHTGYMTMKRYGPFCIDEANQMAMFACMVLAITLSP